MYREEERRGLNLLQWTFSGRIRRYEVSVLRFVHFSRILRGSSRAFPFLSKLLPLLPGSDAADLLLLLWMQQQQHTPYGRTRHSQLLLLLHITCGMSPSSIIHGASFFHVRKVKGGRNEYVYHIHTTQRHPHPHLSLTYPPSLPFRFLGKERGNQHGSC